MIRLHTEPGHPGVERLLKIEANELDEALKRDQELAEMPTDEAAAQMTQEGTTGLHTDEVDRQALDRAEDEGMILRPG